MPLENLPQMSGLIGAKYEPDDPRLGRSTVIQDERARLFISHIIKGEDLDEIGRVIETFLSKYYLLEAYLNPDKLEYRRANNSDDVLDRFKVDRELSPSFTDSDADLLILTNALLSHIFGPEHFTNVVSSYVETTAKKSELSMSPLPKRRTS